MILLFIPSSMAGAMARRTIYLPDSVEELARRNALEGESFSATIARLIEAGAREAGEAELPDWIGSGEGPEDLGVNAERYLDKTFGEEHG
jgi:hypothetical protein